MAQAAHDARTMPDSDTREPEYRAVGALDARK